MTDLETLLSKLSQLDELRDTDGLREVRQEIVAQHPDSEETAEALYKLGLDALFHRRDTAGAIEKFAEASKRKHPFWSQAARTSLGLCYYQQRRLPKALLELRRVGFREEPTPHSVIALSFLEEILTNQGEGEEATRARRERVVQLRKLVHARENAPASEVAFYLLNLAIALQDSGLNDEAATTLQRAEALGADALDENLLRTLRRAT